MKISALPYIQMVLLTILFATTGQVEATLGESANSIETDRQALSAAQVAVTKVNGYSVYEIESAATKVREFVSASGVVFGIAWNGMVPPDLTQILGTYAGEYQKALHHTKRQYGKPFLRVKTPHIIVEEWGHMRDLRGRAYAPVLIPAGLKTDKIK